MQRLANISDYQEIVFGDPENSCLLNFQNTDNQYRYSHKITPNYTGKEKDPLRLYLQSGELCRARLTSPPDLLTGYSYFAHQVRGAYHGARYLDHTLITAWLSVGPMADKYPSLSPYAYCAWNPIQLTDPGGDTIDVSKLSSTALEKYNADIQELKKSSLFSSYYNELYNSTHRYYIVDSAGKGGGGSFEPGMSTVSAKLDNFRARLSIERLSALC